AAHGRGAFVAVNGAAARRLSVSSVAQLDSASLSFSSLSGWAQLGLRDRFLALTDAVWRVRAFGDFLSYCLVAEGAVDIAAEPEVSVWDLAALDILVREAGGTLTGLDGTPGPHRGSAVASNGLLQRQVLERLAL
ncbi:histidinol-phosphatase, partial [Mycobacterium avium 11-0986]